MSATDKQLPTGFEALEPFVTDWAIKGAHQRLQRRLDSSQQERENFFNTGKDLVPAALELLDQKPIAAFTPEEDRLMDLVLSLAHVSLAVEIQRDDEPDHAAAARHMTIVRASSDDDTRPPQ